MHVPEYQQNVSYEKVAKSRFEGRGKLKNAQSIKYPKGENSPYFGHPECGLLMLLLFKFDQVENLHFLFPPSHKSAADQLVNPSLDPYDKRNAFLCV
jgi:hypothetical protein